MSGLHLRIGIWFDESHVPFGGPSVVLTGVVLGLYQWADCEGVKLTIIFNKSGDYNWSLYAIDESNSHNLLNLACGPFPSETTTRGSDSDRGYRIPGGEADTGA